MPKLFMIGVIITLLGFLGYVTMPPGFQPFFTGLFWIGVIITVFGQIGTVVIRLLLFLQKMISGKK